MRIARAAGSPSRLSRCWPPPPMTFCEIRFGAALRHRKQDGEIKMTLKKFELKTLTREEWLAMDKKTLEDELEKLSKEYPLELHTEARRIFSMVRRMNAEKKMGIPISFRSGFAISTKKWKSGK
jgi:hypothetical protein